MLIVPTAMQVRGNIQSTVYAVAEKGADIIKADLKVTNGVLNEE
jgi:hypothetical protein